MALAPLRVQEAADSLAKASTPEPFSSSRTSNWVARAGGLPDYIQHIAHDLVEKRGKTESEAIQMAIGIVKRWARGGGNVDSGTRAAAAKAVAEWEAKKASAHAKSAVQHSDYVPTMADELALREAAFERVAVISAQTGGPDGLVRLLAHEALQEAAGWSPTLKRTASADSELERHDVQDGGQTCGMISKRKGYGPSGGMMWRAHSVNGSPVGETGPSKAAALDALRKHLEDAPARVISLPTADKFLVARPSTYGTTTYQEFPNEGAARHAAGLPAQPTLPEKSAKVDALGEMLRLDLQTLSGRDIPPLRRVQEARRSVPFDLAEAFNPGEPRGFGGKWVRGLARAFDPGHPPKSTVRVSRPGATVRPGPRVRGQLTPRSVVPGSKRPRAKRPKADAQRRYEGGVTRASARARAEHARKPQIAPKQLKNAIGRGSWSASATRAVARLKRQRSMEGDRLVKAIRAGRAVDTEHLHRKVNKDGSLGAYTPERQALHEAIIAALLQGKAVHERPEAHFMAGGPASGKSGLLKTGEAEFEKLIGKESMVKHPDDVVHVDPDTIRAMLPEYKELLKAERSDASSLTHEEASHIAKAATKIALGRQHHVLVDTVGDSEPGKFASKIRDAQRAGYATHVHYATTDIQTALARSKKREEETGRKVPEKYLRDAHREVSARFAQEISKIPGVHLRVIDTTDQPNSVIAEKAASGDKLVIKDAAAFRRFLAKARG